MSSVRITRRFLPLVAFALLSVGLSACNMGFGNVVQDRVEGYDLSPELLAQIRPGQSQALVTTVLGSPQFTNDFNTESAFYYVSTHVSQTSFGLTTVNDRKILAVYFDKNKRVKDRAVYTLKDGRTFTVETRRTPSYGEDRTFVQSILNSFGGKG